MNQMDQLNLPTYDFRIRRIGNKHEIFDEFRKKHLVLTPEEWVRQNLLMYLHHEKGIPTGLIAIERGLTVNKLKKRTDIVVYKNDGSPGMIVECKAPSIKIDQNAFEQIARYNMNLKVSYLLVSNGLTHYSCKIDFTNQTFAFLQEIPNFKTICS